MSDESSRGSYVALHETGELARRAALAHARLHECDLCPHRCQADRLSGRIGVCGIGRKARVHGFAPHFAEESVLTGTRGSGTIFFSGCNLACVFCQNWEASQGSEGRDFESHEVAAMMLALQAQGCHNINLVSPSHVIPQVLQALDLAAGRGLRLPLVYNTGGYDDVSALALLDGVIDIYLPDVKFGDNQTARRYTGADDYWSSVRLAVRAMHAQVGDLVVDERGLAVRGLLVRHLVMPGECASTERVCRFLAEEVSPHTAINVMEQYRPQHRVASYPEIDRAPTTAEVAEAYASARAAGLRVLPL